jgi:hypothetical protein
VLVDAADGDFVELADRIRAAGVKVLPLELIERPLALLDRSARPAV